MGGDGGGGGGVWMERKTCSKDTRPQDSATTMVPWCTAGIPSLHHTCRTCTSSDCLAAVQTQTQEGDRNAEEEQGGSGVSTATDKGQG